MKGLHWINFILYMGRYYDMAKQMMGFVRGMGTGIMAGVAIAAVGTRMAHNNRGFKRRANKTLHTVGDLLDNVQYMFKQ